MALKESTIVYRIIGLESFLSILMNKQERYVRPIDCWQDTFEGYMLHQLDTGAGRRKVLERLFVISGRDTNATIRNLSKLLRSRYSCYAQCWSTNQDSDAMWRIYAYDNKAIQLISSVGNIKTMIGSSSWNGLEPEIDTVKYDIKDEKEALNKILVWNAKIDTAFFHKRPAFEHEAEVRVLLNDLKRYEHIDGFAAASIRANMKFSDKSKSEIDQIFEAISYMVDEKGGYSSLAPISIELKIANLKEYIDGIRVHPQAPDWYVSLIGKICHNYKLKFHGKSDLYRPTT